MKPHASDLVAAAVVTLLPWQQYICHACGYIYDEAVGDADGGLAAGTRYADIPDDWACPLCGVTKSDFELYAAPSPAALRARTTVGGSNRRASSQRHRPGVVIVGGGRAGWQMAENLRAADADLPLTLVSACAGDRYDKPQLSVGLARGIAADQWIKERAVDAARRLNLTLLPHTQAIRICRDTRQLRTTRGNLSYAHLVLAHGAQAALPAALPAALCWRINHLDAYLKLRSALGDTPRQVLIVGAGLIGSELANDLALGGHSVTLLDLQSEPLARWQAEQAGQQLLQAWAQLPLRFVGGVKVAALAAVNGRYQVSTECGQHFEADQVIAAAGLQTPGRLAQSAGLAWQHGIAVDPLTLCSSAPGIYALGDCITVNGQASRFIEPIARQARSITAAILGGNAVPYEQRAALVRVKTSSMPLTLH